MFFSFGLVYFGIALKQVQRCPVLGTGEAVVYTPAGGFVKAAGGARLP
jgi:hypothetical protein